MAGHGVPGAERIAACLGELREQRDDMRKLAAQLPGADRARINGELKDILAKWFQRKLVVIWDFFATGDQIVERICEETPPGYLNRVIGIQNIKGTGLDFVYRWQA